MRHVGLILICLLGIHLHAGAQDRIFTATLFSGEFRYQKSGSQVWTKVSQGGKGISLNASDRIKLAANSQVILGSGSDFDLVSKVGVWNVSQLMTDRRPDQKVASPYIKYLIDNLTHAHRTIDEYAEGYMRKKGLVSRGNGCEASLMQSPLSETFLVAGVREFSWLPIGDKSVYFFSVYDDLQQSAEPFFTREIKGTKTSVSLDSLGLRPGVQYYWAAYSQGSVSCVKYAFKLMGKAEFSKLEEELATLETEITHQSWAEYIIKAAFYEKHNLYVQAEIAYKAALSKQPGNRVIAESFRLFLARNGQLEAAKKISL